MGVVDATIARMRGQRVYFDSNGLIYFFDRTEPFFAPISAILAACDRGAFFGFTGDAAVAELMVHPYRTRNEAEIARGQAFFSRKNFITVLGHDSRSFDTAARLRAHGRLKMIDALHCATAQQAGCKFFITNDTSIAAGGNLEVIRLSRLTQ